MLVTKQKKQLPLRLVQLNLKLNSYFFKRLVLLEENEDESRLVRHYDLECEGIQMLIAVIKKKQQGILMKAISNIKSCRNMNSSKVTNNEHRIPVGTTKRTNLNTTYAISDISPIKFVQGTFRTNRVPVKEEQYIANSNVEHHSNLHHLLEKVKLVNSRNISDGASNYQIRGPETNNIRQTASFYVGRKNHSRMGSDDRYYGQTPSVINYRNTNDSKQYKSQSQFTTAKKSRRQSILNKLKLMEDKMQLLANDDIFQGINPFLQINNIKQSIKTNLQNHRHRQYIH